MSLSPGRTAYESHRSRKAAKHHILRVLSPFPSPFSNYGFTTSRVWAAFSSIRCNGIVRITGLPSLAVGCPSVEISCWRNWPVIGFFLNWRPFYPPWEFTEMTLKDNGSSTFVENGFDKLTLMGKIPAPYAYASSQAASLASPKWEFLDSLPLGTCS
jgi:hypothetical protein